MCKYKNLAKMSLNIQDFLLIYIVKSNHAKGHLDLMATGY